MQSVELHFLFERGAADGDPAGVGEGACLGLKLRGEGRSGVPGKLRAMMGMVWCWGGRVAIERDVVMRGDTKGG